MRAGVHNGSSKKRPKGLEIAYEPFIIAESDLAGFIKVIKDQQLRVIVQSLRGLRCHGTKYRFYPKYVGKLVEVINQRTIYMFFIFNSSLCLSCGELLVKG